MIGKIEFPISWSMGTSYGFDFFGAGFEPTTLREFCRASKIRIYRCAFDTSKVTDTAYMFYGCEQLKSLEAFDTSNVTDMSNMFTGCTVLREVPLFNTSNVTNMNGMFANDANLKYIPLFDTSNVTDMSYMFQNVTPFEIPLFDTSNVTDMSYMFYGSKIETLPLFDTQNVTNMSYMFYLTNIKTVPLFDTQNVTNMSYMFNNCKMLETIPSFDMSKVGIIQYMFTGCTSLKSIPDLNTVNLKSFASGSSSSWLTSCKAIESIGVIDCDSITNIRYFFGDGVRTELTYVGGFRNLGKANLVSETNGSYFMTYAPNLTYESVMNVINLLYDRAANGLSNLTLKLHANHMAMLSEDDIAIATNKGWTLTA